MTDKKPYLIRRAQTILPFGVGSIIDVEGESFVAADIRKWGGKGVTIHEPRLERLLGVNEFKMAPAAPEQFWQINETTPGVPYIRFPRWMFCPECRRMQKIYPAEKAPICDRCAGSPKLVPMRFVMACPNGHLSDVPWDRWAHSGLRSKCENTSLKFITQSGGSGLEFLVIKCETCGAERNLAGITSKDRLKDLIIRCPGLQPWQRLNENENCDAVPQVVQRGAGNLTFASITSSIDIPPHSIFDEIKEIEDLVTIHDLFSAIKTYWRNRDLVDTFINDMIRDIKEQEDLEVTKELVEHIIERELNPVSSSRQDGKRNSEQDLLIEEFNALTAPDRNHDLRDKFIKRFIQHREYPYEKSDPVFTNNVTIIKRKISSIVQVQRLREVRVLKGFSRLSPTESNIDIEETPGSFTTYSGDTIHARLVKADLGKLPFGQKWLPGIEVFGEGIFISFDENTLQEWESKPFIKERVRDLIVRRNEHASYLPVPTARLVMLHTLSHLIVRQLSFECGYSIASLRERIYSEDPYDRKEPMAGILIYTAAGDSEGTLGGLVREGKADRIFSTIIKSIQFAEWCSSDPLCRESRGQGLHNLNLAACHACALLPETSCVMSNRFLDRVLITGDSDQNIEGFFSDLIKEINS